MVRYSSKTRTSIVKLENDTSSYRRLDSSWLEPLCEHLADILQNISHSELWNRRRWHTACAVACRKATLPNSLNYVVIHCGTNNIDRDQPRDIANGVISIGLKLQGKCRGLKVIVTGLLPRDSEWSQRRKKINLINYYLAKLCCDRFDDFYFMKQDDDWTDEDGKLDKKIYYADRLHLVEARNRKFACSILKILSKLMQDEKLGNSSDERKAHYLSNSDVNHCKPVSDSKPIRPVSYSKSVHPVRSSKPVRPINHCKPVCPVYCNLYVLSVIVNLCVLLFIVNLLVLLITVNLYVLLVMVNPYVLLIIVNPYILSAIVNTSC